MGWIKRGCLLLALLLGLTGCAGLSAEELYQLPEATEDYYDLQAAINELLSEGLSYQAPASGTRREPVQLTDLNGDGVDEAVVFFRGAAGEVIIYVLSKEGAVYTPAAVIDGAGSAVASVEYADVDGQGDLEILLSYQVSESVTQALQIHRFEENGTVNLLTASCSQYFLADLDHDGFPEIFCLTGNGPNTTAAVTYYNSRDGELFHGEELRLSFSYDSLRRANKGTLSDGAGAMLVSGVVAEGLLVTDIFVDDGDGLRQVTAKRDVLRSQSVDGVSYAYPADINHNGTMEVAFAEPLPGDYAGSRTNLALRWYAVDSNGKCTPQTLTYQNFDENWYFEFPEHWDGTVTAEAADISNTVDAVRFYRILDPALATGDFEIGNEKTTEHVLTLYTLRGTNRQRYAEEHGLSILYSDSNISYAAELNTDAHAWEGTITLAQVSERFHMLRAGVAARDN